MIELLVRRLLDLALVVLLVLTAIFGMTRLSGDPARLLLPMDVSEETIDALREDLGFNDPVALQYARFMTGALQADFGNSLRQADMGALELVMQRVPNSLLLSATSVLLALMIAIPLGVLAAVRPNGLLDSVATAASVLFQAIPNFWLGLLLVLAFSIQLRWLPTGGIGSWEYLILPAVTLSAYTAARLMRMTRASMLEVLEADYVRTARSKGLMPSSVVMKHALKNAAMPIITITALQFGHVFGSAVIVETIFAWPGLGRLIVQSIQFRDFNVVLAGVFVIAIMYTFINFVADLLYALVDPQVRPS